MGAYKIMKLELIQENKTKILFAVILIVAIAVRILGWPTMISQVNVDEAMTAINAKAIAETGKDMYGTSFPVYLEAWGAMGQSVMLVYIMAFFIKLFGFSFITVRLPMLLISIISIIIFYKLVKAIWGNTKLALVAMVFVAICPWHLLQSIWSIDCNMFPHFMLFSVYLLVRGIQGKKWMLYLSMLFFALTMYTYGVSIYIVPFFLLICGIYLLVKKKVTIKEFILCIIIYLLFSLPILTMYFINAFHIETDIHIGPMTIQYFEANTRTSDMLFFAENIGETLINNITSLFNVFFLQYDRLEWNGTPYFGTVYHISLIFFFIAIVHIIRHKEKRNIGTFFMMVWLILSLLLGIIINGVNINRLNILWFSMLFFSIYGIYIVCKERKSWKYIITGIYVALFIGFNIYLHTTWLEKIDMSGCFSRGIIDGVHYATTIEKDTVYYHNVENIYVRFQNAIDNTTFEHIDNLEELSDKLKNKQEDEAFVMDGTEIEELNIDFNQYQYEQFGNTFIIY